MPAEVGEDVPREPGWETRIGRGALPSWLLLAPADTQHCEFIVIIVIVQPQWCGKYLNMLCPNL